jgi:heptosyltransferase-2
MEKIIITPLYGMGDTIMTTPALELLKKSMPDCEITFFTFSSPTHQIMLNNPHIDRLWYYPLKVIHFLKGSVHVIGRFSFRFDTCINFYPSNRTAYNLFSFLTGAKKRIGHTYVKKNFSQLNWLKNMTIPEDISLHCVQENVRLLKFFEINPDMNNIPPTKIYLTNQEKEAGETFRRSLTNSPNVGIHTGTSTFKNQDKRRWPKESFARMIDLLPDIHFILFGSLDEIGINNDIKASVKNTNQVTIVDNKTIREVAAIIGTLDVFVSNDSGLMHIAAAMNTPVVAILGPTNPSFIHPWVVKHRIARLELPCSPCFFYSPKPLTCSQNNSFKCIHELEPALVANAVKELLDMA